MFEEARLAGYRVVEHKGHTNFAIAMVTTMIVQAIAHNALTVLPVTVLIDGYLGVRDVCVSMPSVIGRSGVERTLQIELSEEEADAFVRSARTLRGVIDKLLAETIQVRPSRRCNAACAPTARRRRRCA